MRNETEKPLVVWLADNPHWAYASILKQVGACLTQYRHEMACLACGPPDDAWLTALLNAADVIVPMYLLYHQIYPDKSRMALMLTGMRPFEAQS